MSRRISYSRHAQKRMRLYQITRADVGSVIANPQAVPATEGGRYAVRQTLPGRFKGLPLKVIYVVRNDETVVISAYPLKKPYKR